MGQHLIADDLPFTPVSCTFPGCNAHAVRVTEGHTKKRTYENRYFRRERKSRLTVRTIRCARLWPHLPDKMFVPGKFSMVTCFRARPVEEEGRTAKDVTMTDPQAPSLEYHSAEELLEMFKKLDAISEQMLPWQETKARKEHSDLFGEAIRPGEYYFKRRTGHGFHDDVKLSQVSMDRFLYALFAGNAQLQYIARFLQEKRLNEMREASTPSEPPGYSVSKRIDRAGDVA